MCKVRVAWGLYPSVEHAYVAAKTVNKTQRQLIQRIDKPSDVKNYGRTLRLRDDWDQVKLKMMRAAVYAKFVNPDLRSLLIDTGDQELVEGNTWGDTFWGICNGEGENHLGRILMDVRAHLKDYHE